VDRVKSGMRFGLFGLFYQDLGPNLKGQYFVFLSQRKEKNYAFSVCVYCVMSFKPINHIFKPIVFLNELWFCSSVIPVVSCSKNICLLINRVAR